jgi:O-antigen ligase
MPLRSLFFIGGFIICALGALQNPIFGILGYMGHYCIGPERQWWMGPFRGMDLRYSLVLALATAVGMALNWRKLNIGKFFTGYESLFLLFLGVIWISDFVTAETIGRYSTEDNPTIKLTKVFVFAFMMSHVVTDIKNIRVVFWTLVICAMILGLQAYEVPYRAFSKGRLESVGGADFSDANRFGGFMASMLFIIAVKFLRSGWRGKIVCFLAGGFTANAVILTRSRGAMMGIGAGMLLALILAPKKFRIKMTFGLIIAGIGVLYLSDARMLERTSTITAGQEERDSSAQSRIEIWNGGVKMLLNNPVFGVGPGNFYQNIGKYQPLHPGRDAHNTFIRCAGELGFPGLIILLLILLNAARILLKLKQNFFMLPPDTGEEIRWLSYGCLTALAAMLAYGMTGTLIYTEYLWWLLTLPACIQRVFDNELAEARHS